MCIPILGDHPPSVVKAYSARCHADALCKEGVVQLTRLDVFRDLDDVRSDAGEGRFEHPIQESDGDMFHYIGEAPEIAFVFSASLPDVDPKRQAKFGGFVVELHEPALFSRHLRAAVLRSTLRQYALRAVEVRNVTYDQGAVVDRKRLFDPGSYIFSKPVAYQSEREFRFAIYLRSESEDVPERIKVRLATPHKFCTPRYDAPC